MRVDLASLGRFNRVGTDGAESAAAALSTLTELQTGVEMTKVNFTPLDSIADLFTHADQAVAIEFDGGLDGQALLTFEAETADVVLNGLGNEANPSYLNEVANILTSSFVDGWAEGLADTIDVSIPEAVENPADRITGTELADFAFVFESELWIDGPGNRCTFYLLPEPASFLDMLEATGEDRSSRAVSLSELSTFIQLTAAGAETVADALSTMTGVEADVAVTNLDFVPITDVAGAIDESEYVGSVFEFDGLLDGYLAVMFDADGASTVTQGLLPDGADGQMEQSAIEELGNVTASGFIDGWANALDTTIDHSVPDFVDDMGRAVLESIAVQLARDQEFAYVFDVAITAEEPLYCRLFAFPDPDGFRTIVSGLDEQLDVSSVERV